MNLKRCEDLRDFVKIRFERKNVLMRVFDLHCDTMTVTGSRGITFDNRETSVSLGRIKNAGMKAYAQCFALFVENDDSAEAEKEWAEHYEWFKNQMQMYADFTEQAESYEDIMRIAESGKTAAILTAENASVFGGKLSRISEMRENGCLIASLTWNGKNDLAGGAHAQEYGLSDFGKEAASEMERCGMVIDVSHLSDRGLSDLLKIARRPFIATHSNSRTVLGHMRNLPDEYIREIIKRGGLIGINYFKEFLAGTGAGSDRFWLDSIAAHIEYILSLGGENAVALGSDYDGAEVPEVIDGIDMIGNLYTYLEEHFGSALTEKIFFDNAISFFRANF